MNEKIIELVKYYQNHPISFIPTDLLCNKDFMLYRIVYIKNDIIYHKFDLISEYNFFKHDKNFVLDLLYLLHTYNDTYSRIKKFGVNYLSYKKNNYNYVKHNDSYRVIYDHIKDNIGLFFSILKKYPIMYSFIKDIKGFIENLSNYLNKNLYNDNYFILHLLKWNNEWKFSLRKFIKINKFLIKESIQINKYYFFYNVFNNDYIKFKQQKNKFTRNNKKNFEYYITKNGRFMYYVDPELMHIRLFKYFISYKKFSKLDIYSLSQEIKNKKNNEDYMYFLYKKNTICNDITDLMFFKFLFVYFINNKHLYKKFKYPNENKHQEYYKIMYKNKILVYKNNNINRIFSIIKVDGYDVNELKELYKIDKRLILKFQYYKP